MRDVWFAQINYLTKRTEMLRKKGTAHAVFDPEFSKSFIVFQKY